MMKRKKKVKIGLLGIVPKLWEREWRGMPEYIQRDMHPTRSIIVHFRNEQDVQAFAKLVKARITHKTKFVWYPGIKPIKPSDMEYVEEKK